MDVATTVFRYIFAMIDKVVYLLVKICYNLLYSISNTTLFTGTEAGSIGGFGHNIYAILGVIMLFKLAFSLITYTINPDVMDDKSKGFGNVIKNVVIVVGLILITPIAFNQAMKLQRLILKEDILGRVITGVKKTGGTTMDETAGKIMAFDVLSGFVRPDIDSCDSVLNSGSADLDICLSAINDSDSDAATKYAEALNGNDIDALLSAEIITAKNGDDDFLFNYMIPVSTLSGGFTAYILLIFCIDVAVRSIKLVFLQLLAPIPIVSYIDPKGQKGVFDKWVKMSISTYLDLFIRLAAIYFAIYIIQYIIGAGQLQTIVTDSQGNDTYAEPSVWVKIFMILGCLMFAKQVPDLIKEFTGKAMGDFTLNPMKKAAAIPLAGAGIAAGLGLAGRTTKNLGKFAGGQALKPVQNLGKKISNSAPMTALSKKMSSMSLPDNEFGRTMGKIGADASSTIGGGITKKMDEKKLSQNKKITDAVSNMESRAKEKITTGGAGNLSLRYNTEKASIEKMKNMSMSEWNDKGNPYSKDAQGHAITQEAAVAKAQYDLDTWLNSNDSSGAMSQYIDASNRVAGTTNVDATTGITEDKTLSSMYKDYGAATSAAGETTFTDAEAMHGQMGRKKGESSNIQRKQMAAQEAKKK